MKKFVLGVFLLVGILTLPLQKASAHVFDETVTKQAQFDYEGYYTLQGSYNGQSGIVVKSYSTKWKQDARLQSIESELLKNKHGEELKELAEIIIFPDYPAGKEVLGQYFANYRFSNGKGDLLPGRVIHLYGGDQFTSIEEIAATLSHEYGHHFTFHYLIEKEGLAPTKWKSSAYAMVRGIDKNDNSHTDGSGEYIWYFPEIFAEDYVQLFGSDLAIKEHAHMNYHINTPFDNEHAQTYWSNTLELPDYRVTEPLPFFLTDYKRSTQDPSLYQLKIFSYNLSNKPTHIIGQVARGFYAPINVSTKAGVTSFEEWLNPFSITPEQAWLLDSYTNPNVHFHAIQYTDKGFNLGSKTLRVNYKSINDIKTTQQEMNLSKALSIFETKKLLHEVALKYNIPPELLKAIAYVETGMKQFDKNGTTIVTADGGIGIMQVTLTEEEMKKKGIDSFKLKTDTRYNIEVGAQILKEKWNDDFIPRINDHNPQIIEHWYFAMMAYNGLSKRNDPNIVQEKKPYQDRIFDIIRNRSFINISEIPVFIVEYKDPLHPDSMSFPQDQLQYNWPALHTKSTQSLLNGDTVYITSEVGYAHIRNGIDGGIIKRILNYTPLEVISGPYETEKNPENHYVFYQVKGIGIDGYIASSDIQQGNMTLFTDIVDPEMVTAVGYLNLNKIINGYQDGTFRPNDRLLRRHAASILVKELELKLPENYQLKASDIKPTDLGYEEMMIAEAHGMMGQDGKLRPNEYLTRAQMAAILVRSYEGIYQSPTTQKVFNDVPTSFWNYDDINTLAYNNITIVESFKPSDPTTRGQFALFLKRTLDLKKSN
ncbi:S-layer homology domain-containing protein [Bacillus salitolerans]|uniref:S-layer homology domain-containing protein n=1 Tax=Bacillus salitolerans TaxID=1437434 RepID=A0ABW4LP55_9BACI